jgi:hypothetical protein
MQYTQKKGSFTATLFISMFSLTAKRPRKRSTRLTARNSGQQTVGDN